ncbi:MAG: BadF/BadG/BcrA/BcrD ATPase family protein [Ignavibacteriaceae bacterium]|nr:BadF/BadG/BcrA/BcrD ATPase family protein [Ignavibacteriaceae bacterium]
MKYLIGIDGGGTKTDSAITDLSGNIIHQTTGKASNFLVVGIEEAVENIFALIEENLFKLEGDFADVKQIVIGVAGAGRKEDAQLLEKSFKDYADQQGIHFKGVKVVSDAHIALEGAFPDSAGCILIAGTGSILFGKDEKGVIHRVGGFGRLIGDEGSGYSIGRKALNAVSKESDGRGEATLISEMLNAKMNSSSSTSIINEVYKEKLDVASVAKIVIEAAEEGDPIAEDILDEEADELVLHIKSLMNKIQTANLNVAFSGSLIDNKNFYSDLLKQKIKSTLPKVIVVKPASTPVSGAILFAKRLAST